ncbi:hypothetical protein ACOMCU_16120 [Lysinibacillus sp. UGB7]|uniref:hypothetical protein n=1 Tax=Lysinibacillus sp. UGB7 TaxID=3411039 RepID=UPI003B770E77
MLKQFSVKMMEGILGRELKEGAQTEMKNYEGYWTYAHSKDLVWEPEPFEKKDEAIAAGREVFPCGFVIGQLKNNENMIYDVVNVEKLSFS